MMIDKADDRGHPIRRLVLTDGHFDHSAGGCLLPSAEIIAQKGAGEWMQSQHAKEYLAQDPPEHPDLKVFTITTPTLEIDGSMTLFLKDRTLHLFPTPGHSPTHMSALLEPDKLLFAGDAVITCFPPVIQDGRSDDALATYRTIKQMDFRWLIPGHGPLLDAASARRYIGLCIDYLQQLQSRLSQIDDPGRSIEEVREIAKDLVDMFSEGVEMVHEWHEKALTKVWEERRLRLLRMDSS
jgi:glyoxylase-like metal-dependent hydrolase (beta-lactamase superfamily II)